MSSPAPVVEYTKDQNVDAELDRQIRELLSSCFTKTEDSCFKVRRYFHQIPQHRFFIRSGERLLGHVAVHDKVIGAGDQGPNQKDLHIGGVAEVSVHPDARGRGYVKLMLKEAHAFMKERKMDFGMLFGDSNVYTSSGYVKVANPLRYFMVAEGRWETKEQPGAMSYQLGKTFWPSTGLIDLRGPKF